MVTVSRLAKDSFCVIGKEGATSDGQGFVEKLWADANSHFHEVAELAKTDDNGNPVGFWGAMSDLSRSFNPWEDNFTKGPYLAGVEVGNDAEAPGGWAKWIIPSYEYLYTRVENSIPETLSAMTKYLEENDLQLAGAVHDFIAPREDGQTYMFVPISKL